MRGRAIVGIEILVDAAQGEARPRVGFGGHDQHVGEPEGLKGLGGRLRPGCQGTLRQMRGDLPELLAAALRQRSAAASRSASAA